MRLNGFPNHPAASGMDRTAIWQAVVLLMLLAMVLSSGCASTVELVPVYDVETGMSSPTPLGRGPLVALSVFGHNETLWYRKDGVSWVLKREPKDIVQEALMKELNTMGLDAAPGLNTAPEHHRLVVQVRWFAPCGEDYRWAVVILSCALYPKGSDAPLWRGRVEGFSRSGEPDWMIKMEPQLLEKTIILALRHAIQQLRWQAGFSEAVGRLA